jgi:GntR family transcriptional regulator, transcriptional repressor for pyruvate dehydrogenase complex
MVQHVVEKSVTRKKPGPARGGRSALARTADSLRHLALAHDEGAFIGSEEELVRMLGASRPTLRQASAQVAQESLIQIRRGNSGGYYACRPQSSVVSRMAAIYLKSHDVALEEVVQAIEPVRIEIAKLATRSTHSAARARLAAFVAADEALDAEEGYRGFLRSEWEFGMILGELSGSRVTMLFLQILYDFAALLRRGEGVFADRPDRVADYRAMRSRMAKAIHEGDEDFAIVATRRCANLVNGWICEDHARSPQDAKGPFDLPKPGAIGAVTL